MVYELIDDGRPGVSRAGPRGGARHCARVSAVRWCASLRPGCRRGALTAVCVSRVCGCRGRVQAVAPGAAFGRAGAARSRSPGRAGALVMVCGLAACVALLGGLGDAEEPVSQAFLAVKAELQSKPAAPISGKVPRCPLPPRACARPPVCARPLTARGLRSP